MIKLAPIAKNIINEGGWASKKTQKTIITPELVGKSIEVLNKFVKDFNKIVTKEGKPPIEVVSPVGSTKYWKQDLKSKPDTHYGDIDMLVSFPVWYRDGKNKQENESKSLKYYFDKIVELSGKYPTLDSDTKNTAGRNAIFKVGNEYVQIDFIATFPEYKEWSKVRYTPEHGLKGITVGKVFTALGVIFNLSMGDKGIIAKMRNGEIVPTKFRKDVDIVKISSNYKTFIRDITKFIIKQIDPSIKTIKEHPDLKKFKGLNASNVKLANFAKGVAGMAKTFELNGIFDKKKLGGATDAKSFMKRVRDEYKKAILDALSKSKFDKAETPEAKKAIEKAKKHGAEGIKIVNKYLK